MTHLKYTGRTAAAALLAMVALAGCHDDHNGGSTPTSGTSTKFSTFVENTYAEGQNTVPIDISAVNFDFDVDTDPTAFNALLM